MNTDASPTCQEAIGASVRRKRTDRGYTQDTLSVATGITQASISLFESGKFGLLNLDTLHEICVATDTPPSEFLCSLDDRFESARRPQLERAS